MFWKRIHFHSSDYSAELLRALYIKSPSIMEKIKGDKEAQ